MKTSKAKAIAISNMRYLDQMLKATLNNPVDVLITLRDLATEQRFDTLQRVIQQEITRTTQVVPPALSVLNSCKED